MPAKFTGPLTLMVDLEKCYDSAPDDFVLGQIVEGRTTAGNWAKFRFVKFEDAVTYLAGHFCFMGAAETDWSVTNDISAAMVNTGGVPAGVVFQTTVPTENQYGWVQCAGLATCLIGTASVVEGDVLKADSSQDGHLGEGTRGADEELVAIATATIADNASGLCLLTVRGT